MKKCLWLVFVLASVEGIAQVSKDSLLANERAMDRPVNVHGGQLRVTGGYGFRSITKRYNMDGEGEGLKEDGFAYARQNSFLEIKFGILESLQFTTRIQSHSALVRNKQVFLVGYPTYENATSIYSHQQIRGLEDLYMGLDFRLPLKTRKLDLMLSAGSFLPTAKSKEPQPENSLKEGDDGDWEVIYRDIVPLGNGTPAVGVGGTVKYRLKNMAFTFSGMHYHGMSKEVDGVDWTYQIDENESFEYRSEIYKRGVPDRLNVMAMVEFQASPFFNVFFQAEHFRASKGWREWEGGKIPHDNFMVTAAAGGFELIITPRIWFKETVEFPLNAENTDTGLRFLSVLSYNLFVKR
jgi:hypothetical protein